MRRALVLVLLLATARAEEYRAVDARTWKRIKKVLPGYLWETRPKRRLRDAKTWADHRYDKVKLTKKQFTELAEILRNGSPFTTQKRRSRTLEIKAGEETIPVRVVITTKYKPGCGRSFPLIISLHGGPVQSRVAAESGASTQFSLWQSYAQTIHGIVACPAITGEQAGQREWSILARVIDELDRIYNVDRDRILLTGHSWGGILTWQIGPRRADTFAGLAPFVCATNPGRAHLANCRNLPVYSVQGKRDIKWILETGRERIEVLKELGYEHVYRELPGGHATFTGEIPKIAKWFAARPRRIYAREVVRSGAHGEGGLWYWVRTEARHFTARIVDRQTIEIDCPGACELFLADAMVDLDQPIRVRRNGEVAFEGHVERRLDFTLGHVRETGDRGRVFAASVEVD
ncbi:MAG: hypothetical protein ACYTED_17460 [Planctomycetota bacterium]